jgi:hypothetical protein
MIDFEQLWSGAMPFHTFVAESTAHKGLWEGVHRLARIPDWAQVELDGTERRLLVLAEDWCGDASNTIPILAKWAEQVDGLDLRIIRRDEHPEVMDRYLTNGSRSIPLVIVLDDEGSPVGNWGPRPDELQDFVMDKKAHVEKKELYRPVRRWYARDRGEATICEVAAVAGIALPTMAIC